MTPSDPECARIEWQILAGNSVVRSLYRFHTPKTQNQPDLGRQTEFWINELNCVVVVGVGVSFYLEQSGALDDNEPLPTSTWPAAGMSGEQGLSLEFVYI